MTGAFLRPILDVLSGGKEIHFQNASAHQAEKLQEGEITNVSENKKYYFLKLKEGYFKEETIVLLESMKDGILYSNILLKLYCMSLKNNGKLQLYEEMPLTAEMIARLTNTEVGTVERAIGVFQQLHLIEELPDGCYYLSQIESMIGSTTTEAMRKKQARDKIRNEKMIDTAVSESVRKLSTVCPPDIREQNKEIREQSSDIRIAADTETILHFGSFSNVLLTSDQLQDLKNRFPNDWEERIERMSRYMQSTGKEYRDHFATLLLWADRENGQSTETRNYQTEGEEIV